MLVLFKDYKGHYIWHNLIINSRYIMILSEIKNTYLIYMYIYIFIILLGLL